MTPLIKSLIDLEETKQSNLIAQLKELANSDNVINFLNSLKIL
jgi:hypothetical protein